MTMMENFIIRSREKQDSEAELDADYEKISSADWYHQAEEAAGKEIMYGYDVLGNSENIISCVKILNKLNTSDKIGLLILQINKNTMRNVIGQFPTDGDIYVLKIRNGSFIRMDIRRSCFRKNWKRS